MSASSWRRSWRADPAARILADRHYNRQAHGAAQFVPPGRCLVLLTADRAAVWVTSWPLPQYVRHAWPEAWICSIFRNEGAGLSSDLITWAVAHTRAEWPLVPAGGIVTFVDPVKTRRKRDPGRCFRRAGWQHVGFTAGGLYVLQQLPAAMPAPAPIPEAQLRLFEVTHLPVQATSLPDLASGAA